ncbi:MAG: dockerin type I domain-containing protein [Usitatibacteraceae bacterium]
MTRRSHSRRASPIFALLTACFASASRADTPLTGIVKISAGSFHTCALTTSGGVKCWGVNQTGQLGIDPAQSQSTFPIDVPGLTSGIADIAAGGSHTCALTTTGGVKCWGLNQNGQLGDNGPLTVRFSPTDVSGLATGVASISAGRLTSCAVTSSGGAKCWGANGAGQLGDGTTVQANVPADVAGLGSGVGAIATYNGHACAVTVAGGVKCWGQNNSGQLGTGFPPVSSLIPVDVISAQSAPALTGASGIVVSFATSCALTSGGALCWGDDGVGQLGNDSAIFFSNVPVSVLAGASQPALGGVTAIASGNSHSCAVTGGGVKCWGFNTSGQLGNGNNNFSVGTPVDVIAGPGLAPLSGVTAISAGETHTCALMSDTGVKCWGANFRGELGANLPGSYQFTPVDVVVPSINLVAVQSRKPHGATGSFDVALDTSALIGGAVSGEPRTIGTGHTIVFQFEGPVTAVGTVTAVDSVGAPVGTAVALASGNEVLVTLTGIPDNSRATIAIAGVNGGVNASVSAGFLVGDVNNTRSVNSSDISGVKARSGQTTDATNFKFDLNASGAINSSDISAVKARSGLTLP